MPEFYETTCPKCGSSNVGEDKLTHFSKTAAIRAHLFCQDCGYSAPIFPEVSKEDQEKVQEKFKKTPDALPETNVDIRYGKFEWWWLKVTVAIYVILVIIVILYKIFS